MRSFVLMLMALLMGAALPLQAAINANLRAALASSITTVALISFIGGALVLLIAALLQPGAALAPLVKVGEQPLWRLVGGPLGAAFIFGTTFLAPRLGLTALLSLVIAGQLIASLGIDHIGFGAIVEQKISASKVLGGVLVIVGVFIVNIGRR